MALRHLTDDQIQEYLDRSFSNQDFSVERHLETCWSCQRTLEQYRGLFLGLKREQDFTLSSGFAKSILSKLPANYLVKPQFNHYDAFLVIAGVIIALATTLYYMDLKLLGELMIRTPLLKVDFSASLLALARTFLVISNGSISLLTFAGLTIIIIAIIDHVFFQPKYRYLLF